MEIYEQNLVHWIQVENPNISDYEARAMIHEHYHKCIAHLIVMAHQESISRFKNNERIQNASLSKTQR